MFGGYAPFAALGFVFGTLYQYGLPKIMINIIFADVSEVPKYNFDVPVFFCHAGGISDFVYGADDLLYA